MESEEKSYVISDLENTWLEYDRQNDILYINFGHEVEEADEEVLSGEDVVLRIKNNRLVSIMIMNFAEKVGISIC